jgi:DNA modification methylase
VWVARKDVRKGSTNGRATSTLASAGSLKTVGVGMGNDIGETKQYRGDESNFCQFCGAWLGCFGLEPTPELYIEHAVAIFHEIRRVLRDDGTLWLNIGDSYARNGGTPGGGNREMMHLEGTQSRMTKLPKGSTLKEKDLVGIPWMLAFALRADGWYLRQEIIWAKPNPMPESVTDRCTKSHESLFLLSKSPKYYFDHEAIKEPAVQAGRVRADKMGGNKGDVVNHSPGAVFNGAETRNRRSVWSVTTQPFPEAHFATFPPKLIEPCILAGCPENGTVLDPFAGSGTTGLVALRHKRNFIGIELNPEYIAMANNRILKELLS